MPKSLATLLLICIVSMQAPETFAQKSGNDTTNKLIDLNRRLVDLLFLRQDVLKSKTDKERMELNNEFLGLMRNTLEDDRTFEIAMDTIPNIGDLRSPDGFFRMITWNLPFDDQTNRYYCFIQHRGKKKKDIELIELKRGFQDLKGQERKVYTDRDWYGALYYQIIPSGKRKQRYTLLGWDGNSQYSTIKVADPLTFTNRGVKFGADIFKWPEGRARRLLLEFKSDAAVALRYEKKGKRIVYNQLVPMQPDLEGLKEFYIPVLQFDALVWKKRKWVLEENIDVRLDEKREYNLPPPPPKP